MDRRRRAVDRHDGRRSAPLRPYATKGYLKAKNEEAYANVFTPHYPDEERQAARPLKTAPCYDRMKALGAVFGSVYGWERPNWFAPPGYGIDLASLDKPDVLTNENHPAPDADGKVKEIWSFRRSNYFEHVGNEIANVTTGVGLQDMSPFAKAIVSGPGARQWLDQIFANRIPKMRGRIALCHLLSRNGGVRAEFTVYERAPDEFYLVSAGALERHDHDTLRKLLPDDGSVSLEAVTQALGVLVLAGPRSRDVLGKLTDADLSNAAFPWLSGKEINVGFAMAHALRVNFVGELGFELHHPIEMQNALFDLIMEAGKEFGIKPFGIRAMLFHGDREILPARRARAVDRIRRARIRARPLRASQQGGVPRPRCPRSLAREGLRQPLRDAACA